VPEKINIERRERSLDSLRPAKEAVDKNLPPTPKDRESSVGFTALWSLDFRVTRASFVTRFYYVTAPRISPHPATAGMDDGVFCHSGWFGHFDGFSAF
jgi:hypothetical protein